MVASILDLVITWRRSLKGTPDGRVWGRIDVGDEIIADSIKTPTASKPPR
jgi:hypothetical protein